MRLLNTKRRKEQKEWKINEKYETIKWSFVVVFIAVCSFEKSSPLSRRVDAADWFWWYKFSPQFYNPISLNRNGHKPCGGSYSSRFFMSLKRVFGEKWIKNWATSNQMSNTIDFINFNLLIFNLCVWKAHFSFSLYSFFLSLRSPSAKFQTPHNNEERKFFETIERQPNQISHSCKSKHGKIS